MAEENEHQLFDITESPSQADRDLAAMLFAETAPPAPPVGEETLAPSASPAAPEKPGFLSRLKGMFRRSAPPDAVTPEGDALETEEAAKPGLLTRLFRRAPAEERSAVEATGEAVAPETAEEEASAEETTETQPSPHKKILLVSLLLLVVLGIGVGSAVLTFKRLQASKEAEYHQQAEDLARQQEALKKQQEEMAALKAQNEKLTQEAEAAKTAPPAPPPPAAQAKPTPEAGDVDCAVVGKENAADTIKRCIEAYNRATGRTK
ncbi:MAG: hypothetical protein AB7U30_13595 [Sulfuricellaceae bacterium]|jgi:hypothetical protein